MKKSDNLPHAPREIESKIDKNRGRLENGNQGGDLSKALRCGALSRRTKQPCQSPAVRNKLRCRMHGGKSTGPQTKEGRERARHANWQHGNYSAEAIELRQNTTRMIRESKKLKEEIEGN